MNYSEMTPKQLGWFISDNCELPKLGAFIEQKMEELASLRAKCDEQAEDIAVLEGYKRSFVMRLSESVND